MEIFRNIGWCDLGFENGEPFWESVLHLWIFSAEVCEWVGRCLDPSMETILMSFMLLTLS